MGENSTLPSVEALNEDPEARLEFLVGVGVFETSDEDVSTTTPFEDTRSIYADTYTDTDDEELAGTVADLFGVSREEARDRVAAEEVTVHEVVTFLSLQSFLDRDLPRDTMALLAAMASEVGFGSSVPDGMTELTDDDYRDFLDDAGDAIVFVWKYPCDPCRRMKGEIPDLLAELPEDVAVAGVDGMSVVEFRKEFDVESAPTVLLFADGDLAERHDGYATPGAIAESIADVYGVDVAVDVGSDDA